MVTVVIFCLAIFVGNLNVLHFWNSSLIAGLMDLFQAPTNFFFPSPMPPLHFAIIFVYSQHSRRGVEKKKREIPCVRHLELSLHAGASQLSQKSGNPCRAHYRWLAENHWILTGELRNPKGLCWTQEWWPEILDLALSRSSALQCFPWTLPMLFTWDRSYFAWLGDFQTVLNNIFSELAFGSAVFEWSLIG